jgi:hypothetical protein
MRITKLFFAAAAALTLGLPAQASIITTNSLTNTSVYDFSSGANLSTGGPVTRAIGDQSFVFTSTVDYAVFDYTYGYGLDGNGMWDSGMNGHAGLNGTGSDSMTFTFAEAVSGVGGLINYAPDYYGSAILKIFDAFGGMLESFDLTALAPINTYGVDNQGAFRGFDFGSNAIKSFSLSGAYIVIDDLVISQLAPVPLPAGLPLMLIAMGGFAMVRRRKTQV